ncbi:MAG: peptidase [Dehalococcoidia bacterium]
MTFCLGMKCHEGLIAIADTRITSGSEVSVARKISVHQFDRHSMFILTSGLRSIRDKAITYFEERLRQGETGLDRMYQAANALAEELRRVRVEDGRWLEESGLHFDLHCLIGGQMAGDTEARLYLIYPEGNWVEVRAASPYLIIGESRYGKPILDRIWRYGSTLSQGLHVGLLAFDATRTSSGSVDYPLDVALYRPDTFVIHEQRYTSADLDPFAEEWQRAIERAVASTEDVVLPLFRRLEFAPAARTHFDHLGGDEDGLE